MVAMWKPQHQSPQSKLLLNVRLAPPRVPKRRSRGGCTYCKEKKKKCDEQKPCARCAERGLDCAYEPVKPRQRRKRHSIATAAIKRSMSRSPSRPVRSLSAGSQESDESLDDSRPMWTLDEQQRARDFVYGDAGEDLLLSPLDTAFDTSSIFDFRLNDPTLISPVDPVIFDGPPQLVEDDETPAQVVDRRDSTSSLAVVPRSRSHYPHLAMIAPCPLGSPLREFRAPGFFEFSDRANRRALVDHFCSVLSHLIVFREESGNPFQQLVLPLTQNSPAVMDAIYALASAHLEYRGVENGEKSIYFHNQAILGLARLIEHDGQGHRNEILAAIMLLVYYEVLVQRGRNNIVDGHLKGALAIMCANAEPLDATGVFLERAFRFYDVIAALSNGTAPLSAAPAAGCLVPFPPLGAQAASPLSNVDTLLGMATTLWPIIHRLSNLLSLKSELQAAINSNAMSTKITVLRTEFESTADAIESALAQWQPNLPPGFVPDEKEVDDPTFIPRIVTELTTPTAADDNVEHEIPTDTQVEEPLLPPTSTPTASLNAPSERRRIHSILHNALAYRHSAFVYLYRTIYSRTRSHALVQRHAHLALTHCVHTVSHAGPMGALLWPLFVAACEAVIPADRQLARRAFEAIRRRQGMMNIERAWEIVKEVWRRADWAEEAGEGGASDGDESIGLDGEGGLLDGEGGGAAAAAAAAARQRMSRDLGGGCAGVGADLWRRVSEDMGVNIVFG